MDALTGRRTWRTLEPYHGAIYFVPEAAEEYAALGIDDRMSGYFGSRSAPMGAVDASVVIATFYNFDHDFVRRSMADLWNRTTPSQLVDARYRAADRMLRAKVLSGVEPERLARAAELARIAADAACERPEGRPLFAAHAALDWPDEDHLVLWHAQTLLREYRGDGHVAALVEAGLSGCEALVTHGAAGDVPAKVLRESRQRTESDWSGAVESLRQRGLDRRAWRVHRSGSRVTHRDRRQHRSNGDGVRTPCSGSTDAPNSASWSVPGVRRLPVSSLSE